MTDDIQPQQADGHAEEEVGAVAQERAQESAASDAAAQADEYLQGWRRAKADYENLKKEMERERASMASFARGVSAMEFIPIYDNFKKAAQHEPALSDSDESKRFTQWMQGIQHIKSQFKDALRQMGVEEIPAVGTQFDPRMHEAVEERAAEGVAAGQIIEEVSGGYKMGDRVIQVAKVIIAK